MERRFEIAPFGGLVTSVDESVIGANSASDLNNVRIGDGRLKMRLGHSQIASALASASVIGSEYVRGYDDSYVYKDEIIQFLQVSGVRKPYGVNLGSGVRTEIKDGTTPLSLASGDWTALSFNGEALAYKRGAPVYRHAIGDATSWKALDVSPPASLSGAASVSFEVTEDLSSNTPAGDIDWTSTVSGDFSNLVNTTYHSAVGTGFKMTKTVSGAVGFDVLIPGNPLDYSGVDTITFTITIPGQSSGYAPGGVSSVTLKIIDATANDFAFDVAYTFVKSTGVISVTATVPSGTDMSEFDDTEKIQLSVHATYFIPIGGGWLEQTFDYTISEFTLATSDPMGGTTPTISGSPERMRFGVAPYDSETGQEASDVQASAWFQMDSGPTRYFDDAGSVYFGNIPTVALPTPVSPANNQKIYVMFESQNIWRLVTTSEESDYEIALTATQLKALPERQVIVRDPIGNVKCGCAHSGFVAWGIAGGKSNLKLSAIGDPGRLANDLDYLEDSTRGANFTLADDFSDEAVGMASSDVSLYIGGNRGLYVMTGTTPSTMSPPKRVPGSSGLIGARAITKWRDDSGNPGCAYIDTTGRLWLAQVLSNTSEFGLRLSPIDFKVQGYIDSWLFNGSAPTAEQVSLVGDFETDSLWLCYGSKTLVLRRASIATGEREWEAYTYSSTWSRIMEDDKNSPIAVKSDSAVHRLDSGTTDGGSAITNAYWQSREFSDQNRSLHRIESDREPTSSTPSVTVYSDRGTTTKTWAANLRHVKFHVVTQQGWKHKIKVTLDAVTTVINRIIVTERMPAGKGLDR